MENYSAFCETFVGANHLKRGLICQDASICVNDELYTLAAVADGHGSAWYLRTDIGSRLCVESAAECVGQFMRELKNPEEQLNSEKEREMIFLQLWRSIVSRWHEAVEAHFAENPFTDEELDRVPEIKAHYRTKYADGDYLSAYGTTLILAVTAEDFAFCMQIGDGKCVVLGDDAEAWLPVPHDSRCYDGMTTSMCQEDAVLSMRYCYFSAAEIPSAIFLGSDGIDGSYGNDELLCAFYRGLALTMAQFGSEEGKRQLSEFLPKMTEKGSGDDVSCAGIINIQRLRDAEELMLSKVQQPKSSEIEIIEEN